MTDEMLKEILETARARADKDGWSVLPEGRTLTLHAAHEGVSLTVSKVERIVAKGGIVHARNVKGEHFLLALADVFAAAVEGQEAGTVGRKAGFLG